MDENKNDFTNEDVKKPYNPNLIAFKKDSESTEEEKAYFHEIRVKGGKARQKQIIERKTMNEEMKNVLYTVLSREQAQEILGSAISILDSEEKPLTVMNILNVRLIQEAAQGNSRAFELIRDTAGFSPKQEISLEADVTTDADRELMNNVLKRLG